MTGTFEDELENLLDRQRGTLRRLWILAFVLLFALILAANLLLDLGTIGWGGLALGALLAFLALQGAVSDYRSAHEAVVRRVARR